MGDHLKKVQSGDALKIPAATFNAMIDAARDHRQRQRDRGRDAKPAFRQTGIVPVKNASGADRDRFDVLGVDSPIFTPADSLDGFKNQVAFEGVTPSVSDHRGRFVVLLQPIASGEIGLACVSGVCPAQVEVSDDANDAGCRYADVKASAAALDCLASGSAAILWREAGTGTKWAVVKLGVEPNREGDGVWTGAEEWDSQTEQWDKTEIFAWQDGAVLVPHLHSPIPQADGKPRPDSDFGGGNILDIGPWYSCVGGISDDGDPVGLLDEDDGNPGFPEGYDADHAYLKFEYFQDRQDKRDHSQVQRQDKTGSQQPDHKFLDLGSVSKFCRHATYTPKDPPPQGMSNPVGPDKTGQPNLDAPHVYAAGWMYTDGDGRKNPWFSLDLGHELLSVYHTDTIVASSVSN